jgi:NAD(P)-dependent dehydrogenase (short-subunit alcohol dehydrogenase family)
MRILHDKVVIVTGAGGSIGRAVALQMAREGARVVVNDLGCSLSGRGSSNAPAEETCRLIREEGGSAVLSTDSIADWGAAHRIVEAGLDAFGRIDAVVNVAGNLCFTPFHEIDEAEWRSIIDVQLNGAFFISRAAIPHFLAQRAGTFVHFTSTSGLYGRRLQAHYAAAKLGVTAMCRTIAMETEGSGVRVNCIAPIANSRMSEGVPLSPGARAALDRLSPAAIAPMAVYLVSDLSSEVNAQVFLVRGDEIILINQSRAGQWLREPSGWSVQSIADKAIPQLRRAFSPIRGEDEKIISAKLE